MPFDGHFASYQGVNGCTPQNCAEERKRTNPDPEL
jgi:hypothetical protein